MRKIFLFITAFIAFNICAISQSIDYFSNNSYWRMQSICNYGFPCVLVNEYGNFVSGDTIVNDITYQKLITYNVSRTEWQSAEPQNPNCFTADTSSFLNCLIRQADKKVFVKYGLSDETLMYDFDLQINDFLPSTSVHPQTDLVVVATDSVLIQNEYRKTFQIEGSAQFTLIEGIGTNFGLIESVFPTLECSYSFFCYWENGTPVYLNSETQDCNQVVGIQDFEFNSTVVYPNPFEKFIYLRGKINNLSIMDYSGRRIEKYFKANQSNEIVQLDLTELQSGIYFIRYLDNNGTPNFHRVIKR